MASGQTSYVQTLTQALQGMIDRPLAPTEVVSKTATVAIAEGLGVSRVADETIKLPGAAGDVTATFEGVAVRLTAREPHDTSGNIVDGGAGMYANKDMVPVLKAGVIWVPVEAACTGGNPVYCRHTVNGGLNVIGGFADGAGTGLAAVPNAKFIDTLTGAGLARIRIGV